MIYSIVAVHGLGSKPSTAWAYNPDEPNWLRDFLPQDLKVRVIAYYHSSHWQSHSLLLSLDDLGSGLLDAVRYGRSTLTAAEQRSRPIIFIGYSFGGIIVKKVSRATQRQKHTSLMLIG